MNECALNSLNICSINKKPIRVSINMKISGINVLDNDNVSGLNNRTSRIINLFFGFISLNFKIWLNVMIRMMLAKMETNLKEVNELQKISQKNKPVICRERQGIACHSKKVISPEFKNVNIGFE